jgi:hypothetical protein
MQKYRKMRKDLRDFIIITLSEKYCYIYNYTKKQKTMRIYIYLTAIVLVLFMNFIFPENPVKITGIKHDHMICDANVSAAPNGINKQVTLFSPPDLSPVEPPSHFSTATSTIEIAEISPIGRTFYDIQSNGSPQLIQQDRNDPRNIHAVCMVDSVFQGIAFLKRRTKYFYSNDTGATWQYKAELAPGIRSGFPCILLLRNGLPVIGNHSNHGDSLLGVRAQFYAGVSIGSSSFTRLDPGGRTNVNDQPEWPMCSETGNIANTNKFVFTASKNGEDTAFKNSSTNISTGTFTGYSPNTDIGNGGYSYTVATSPGGKIGIAYRVGDLSLTVPGSVKVIESTDDGNTFSAPQTIWTPNYTTDSLATLKGLDAGYNGENVNVTFEVCVQTLNNEYFPKRPSRIYFWAAGVNGGVPVLVDTAQGITGNTDSGDIFSSVCRPVLGYSSDNSTIALLYCRARNETDVFGTNYYDIYFKCSENNGAIWSNKLRVTNNSGPLRDCRYVSVSDRNFKQGAFSTFHVFYQQDSIPGSNINGAGNPGQARIMYAKIRVNDCGTVGINNQSTGIPSKFTLSQNYPNPFNPATQIEFGVPKGSQVKITVFNSIGEEIDVIADQNYSAGTYKVNWDASALPTGVYFYVLKAENYTESKKMLLIK